MKQLKAFLRARGVQEVAALSFMLGLIIVVIASASDLFLTPRNLTNLLIDSTTVGIIAVLSTLLMISGGLDLSVASTAALCGVMIGALQHTWGLWPAVATALVVGALVGLINGLLVTYVGINPLLGDVRLYFPMALPFPCATRAVSVLLRTPRLHDYLKAAGWAYRYPYGLC